MDLDEQRTEFEQRLRAWDVIAGDFESRILSGASNVPFWIPGGFRLGIWNIDKTDFQTNIDNHRPMVFGACTTMPGGTSSIYFGFVFDTDGIRQLEARRDELQNGKKRCNNGAFYLHNGKVYVTTRTELRSIDPTDPLLGDPIPLHAACFTDVLNEGQLGLVAADYVNKLGRLLAPVQLVRLGAGGRPVGGPAIQPGLIPIDRIVDRIASYGLVYHRSLVERFHCAANSYPFKHFVLLTGISGTGKSKLAQAYAYAIHNLEDLDRPCEDFYLIPVRPEWNEPSQLIGFFNALSGRYQVEPFLHALLRANSQPHRPVFVCLDEMNLAQPEYYFADILSVMESRQALRLHDADAEKAEVPNLVPWPSNLYIIGTVNVDETTRPFSPKVLDRANVINMSRVVVEEAFMVLGSKGLGGVLDERVRSLIEQLLKILSPHELHFGYRPIEEICWFLKFASDNKLLGPNVLEDAEESDVLDIQIEQKILTKLRGGPEHEAMLNELARALDGLDRSKATVERMKQDLGRYGSFQYWS